MQLGAEEHTPYPLGSQVQRLYNAKDWRQIITTIIGLLK